MTDNELAEIKARLAALTVTYSRIELAATWDVARIWHERHMLSAADNDDNVIICVVMKPHFGFWSVSPPGFHDRDYASGRIRIADFDGRASALAEAKRLALAAWERWCEAPPSERTAEDPDALQELQAHAPEDIAALVAEVERLRARDRAGLEALVREALGDDHRIVRFTESVRPPIVIEDEDCNEIRG